LSGLPSDENTDLKGVRRGLLELSTMSNGSTPRRSWGYLPEERGLYPKVEVEEQLLFLARLHGLGKSAARTKLDE
jgi:ABC-type uncharacterized transport system ATPase subunit